MEMVLAEANKSQGPIYTFGPLIHNRQVVELLKSKGVHEINDIEGIRQGTVVIRAHGIPPEERRALKDSGLRIINATCPRVARVQAIIRSHTKKGYKAVIVGDRDHAEVKGLQGCAEGGAHVIGGVSELEDIPQGERLVVVAQTTQEGRVYEEICQEILKRHPGAVIFDTICDATHNRQAEIRSFKGQVDGLVVVGGYHSGNTQRLAQVGREEEIETFHIETEKELDRDALGEMETIGVTAGASTPNWMIKAVVQEIERIQSKREGRMTLVIKKVLTFLLYSNLWVALGAFSLTHAATLMAGRAPDWIHPFLAALYIWAMRILNRFLDKGAGTYNEPDRAHFYRKNRNVLILCGMGAVAVALVLAWSLGAFVLAAVAGVSALGLVYSLPIVPVRRKDRWKTAKIKDIPGSKTFSESLAWGVVIALIPLLESGEAPWDAAVISFIFVLAMANVRSALFDIFQVQGDLIVGVETLPITIGEKKTLKILKTALVVSGIIVIGGAVSGIVSPFGFVMVLVLLTFGLTLKAYEKRWVYSGPRLEALVEGNLILSGILGSLWMAVT
jgi:4-hydroxy-3-methylbut-2-enyl diphosphate reductase